jgi:hypothetical protein
MSRDISDVEKFCTVPEYDVKAIGNFVEVSFMTVFSHFWTEGEIAIYSDSSSNIRQN